jgi:hypothetical protein
LLRISGDAPYFVQMQICDSLSCWNILSIKL